MPIIHGTPQHLHFLGRLPFWRRWHTYLHKNPPRYRCQLTIKTFSKGCWRGCFASILVSIPLCLHPIFIAPCLNSSVSPPSWFSRLHRGFHNIFIQTEQTKRSHDRILKRQPFAGIKTDLCSFVFSCDKSLTKVCKIYPELLYTFTFLLLGRVSNMLVGCYRIKS